MEGLNIVAYLYVAYRPPTVGLLPLEALMELCGLMAKWLINSDSHVVVMLEFYCGPPDSHHSASGRRPYAATELPAANVQIIYCVNDARLFYGLRALCREELGICLAK